MKVTSQAAALLVPMGLTYFIDAGLTLALPPAEYWVGNYSAAVEAIGPLRWAMSKHPALLVAVSLCYFMFCCAVVVLTKPWFARQFALLITITHTWGASTWLWSSELSSAPSMIFCLHIVVAICATTCLDRSFKLTAATHNRI